PKIQGQLEASVSSEGRRGALRGPKRGWCKLVELPKILMVAGCKIFMRAEDIPRDEDG
ncbi:hypothetical protein A2U01_0087553, partial [Trifolium medium]|nr:hypothetical protein [Trifolium medium]